MGKRCSLTGLVLLLLLLGSCIGLSALICGAFLWKNWSTLWLVFAITSVALGLPLLLPVGAFFLEGMWTRVARFLAVKLASCTAS